VPSQASSQSSATVDLLSVREGNPPLARMIRTECPEPGSLGLITDSVESTFDVQ